MDSAVDKIIQNLPKSLDDKDLLSKLRSALDGTKTDRQASFEVKLIIWSSGLLQQIASDLQQRRDVKMHCEKIIRSLTVIKDVTMDFHPPDKTFEQETIPLLLQTFLIVAQHIQAECLVTPEPERTRLCDAFKRSLDDLYKIVSYRSEICPILLADPWMMSIVLVDDANTESIALMFLHQTLSACRKTVNKTDQKVLHAFLDELICKLTTSTSPDVGRQATTCILLFCEARPDLLTLFDSRYKGLRPLLSRWHGKGFHRELKRLWTLLDKGSPDRTTIERNHRAAAVIQAHWRGRMTRERLAKAKSGVKSIQTTFRIAETLRKKREARESEQREMKHNLFVAHKQRMREFRQRQLDTIASLPPDLGAKYIADQRMKAILVIQSAVRAMLARRRVRRIAPTVVNTRAAVVVQRCVRRWLARIRKRRRVREAILSRPKGLTDARRVELQNEIKKWQMARPQKEMTMSEHSALHERAQDALRSYLLNARKARIRDEENETLCLRLEHDAKLVSQRVDDLSKLTEADVTMFECHSGPVIARAKEAHIDCLRRLTQPWYRNLDLENLEEDSVL